MTPSTHCTLVQSDLTFLKFGGSTTLPLIASQHLEQQCRYEARVAYEVVGTDVVMQGCLLFYTARDQLKCYCNKANQPTEGAQ